MSDRYLPSLLDVDEELYRRFITGNAIGTEQVRGLLMPGEGPPLDPNARPGTPGSITSQTRAQQVGDRLAEYGVTPQAVEEGVLGLNPVTNAAVAVKDMGEGTGSAVRAALQGDWRAAASGAAQAVIGGASGIPFVGAGIRQLGRTGKAVRGRLPSILDDVPEEEFKSISSLLGTGSNPPLPSRAQPGEVDRISTRVPTAVKQTVDPHTTPDLIVNLDSSRASGDAYAKNAEIIRGYSDVPASRLKNPDAVSERLINHVKDNLHDIYEDIPPEIRNRSKHWYDGANTIAKDLARDYGLSERAVAAALAALSPQKDWYQNADLARRVIRTRAEHGNFSMTRDMNPILQRYIDMQKVPERQAVMQGIVDDFRKGKPLAQMRDPLKQAVWVRAFDEAHNGRGYPIVTPEGRFAGPSVTGSGAPQKVGWGSFSEIAKANSVLNDDSLRNISTRMGGNHKVRNFYNNIISPNAPYGDVTIDTHAIAAGHMRPLSGNHVEVANGLGMSGASSAATGSQGLYGLYADAYRRAATEAGILPREMQSITWEGIRGLFSPEQKRNKNFIAAVSDLWKQHGRGRMDAGTIRDEVKRAAGGIDPPEWWRSGD